MKLDETNKDRSYLYGRLYAILEFAAYISNNYDDSQLLKLSERYSNHPRTTYRKIEETVIPEYNRSLTTGQRNYIDRIKTDILGLLIEDFKITRDEPLSDSYVIGYYTQRAELSHVNIAYQRKLKGLTQQQLADKIVVEQKDISRWESFDREPSVSTLIKIAETLQCSVDDLLIK